MVITFGDIEVAKHKFHQQKSTISIYDVKIDRIVVSSKLSFGKKCFEYFLGFENDDEKVCPCVLCPCALCFQT